MKHFYDWKEGRKQKKKARAAFREYARNGWESPWLRKHPLMDSILHR